MEAELLIESCFQQVKLYGTSKYHHVSEKYIQNQRGEEGKMVDLKACPQQSSCQVSAVNVVKTASEESQETGIKSVQWLLFTF